MRHILLQAAVLTLFACVVVSTANAQSVHTKNTYKLDPESPRPKASIEPVSYTHLTLPTTPYV